MKNILVVFTGGTIGSSVSEGTINTSSNTAFQLLHLFKQYAPDHQINFTALQPLQILSENLAPPVWQTLISTIEQAKPEQFDGIIITHGTDTLAYTAAALSFYFNTLSVPLLLVSSDYPLVDNRANGLENFVCAVEFIRQKIDKGVFVPYRNRGQLTQVHFGSRLTCSLQLTGDFYSVQGKSYLQFEKGKFLFQTESEQKQPSYSQQLKASFSERIQMIKPYPGLDYRQFLLNNVDAVLHDLYHSGTACVTQQWGQQFSLLEFISECKKRNIKVFLSPIFKSANAYQSTQALMEQGVEFIWNMSIEAAFVKLMLAYGNFADDQQRLLFMNTDVAGETI